MSTRIFPSEVPENSNSPIESVVRTVTFELAAFNLIEATLEMRSLDQTSMSPHFVPVNTYSLFAYIELISNLVEKDPITAFVDKENTFHEA